LRLTTPRRSNPAQQEGEAVKEVPVILSKYQTPVLDSLKADARFGSEDAEIIRRVFLEWCAENEIEPAKGFPVTKLGKR
jgi:hypothetical protein